MCAIIAKLRQLYSLDVKGKDEVRWLHKDKLVQKGAESFAIQLEYWIEQHANGKLTPVVFNQWFQDIR
ncbi:MAG: hypothetical protein KME30_17260 [Iphinoe sp. HA4291-MV1]|nr:hypothetical protein [Iphinoe sp. HA4291-MV1]